MPAIRAAVTYGLFPCVFFGALWSAFQAAEAGVRHSVILAAITVSTAVIIAIFERVHPAHERWNRAHDDVGTDSLHALISMVLLPKALELALLGSILQVATHLSNAMGGSLWPHAWPMPAQLLLAMIGTQLGEYWWHRLCHENAFLWRFHAIHHSAERLYWLNAARFHPFDTAASYLISLMFLGLLGLDPVMLLLVSTWVAVHGLFQHCNIHLRLGPLNYVFSMAELHRWHHSLDLEEANSNYGNNIIFWDLVFGTYFHPKDRDARASIGIEDIPDFPKKYVGQLMAPFRWRWPAENEAGTERPGEAG